MINNTIDMSFTILVSKILITMSKETKKTQYKEESAKQVKEAPVRVAVSNEKQKPANKKTNSAPELKRVGYVSIKQIKEVLEPKKPSLFKRVKLWFVSLFRRG